jgi:transcriptional regulator with XRE-family HTH domain
MIRGSIEKIPKNYSQTFSHHMPQRVKITVEQEERIVEALTARPHASQVARDTGWSFSTVWRVAQRAGIELTAGRETMGRHRLSPEERARVIDARHANPDAPQQRIAQEAGVSRSTVWRIERGRRGALAAG